MVAGVHWELVVVLGYFGVFVVSVGYAQWLARGMDVHRGEGH
ncbi:hypothetical protein SAMN05428969_3498 [Devosia sp. YR412]|nr:hypothetical protein SAMN05428969_3498 [Devosia sp. YR412]